MKVAICERCGKEGTLYKHHKDFNHGNDRPFDIELLCPSCHVLTHGIARRKAREANYPYLLLDQSKPGWSKGLSWQELMDARQYPSINVSNL